MQWLRERPLPLRVVLVVLALAAAFFVSAGIGATGGLVVQGGFGILGDDPRPSDEGASSDPPRQETTGAQRETEIVRQSGDEYPHEVGEIQGESVEAFGEIDGKLRRYDALGEDDLGEIEASLDVLESSIRRVEELEPPQQHEQQYETFRAAIEDLYEAGDLAYRMVDDPLSVTPANEDAYDERVNNALANLRRSNEMLNRDYEVVEGARENVL